MADDTKVTLAEDPASSGWHVDKRVPVALLAAISLQFAGSIWWAAQTSARLDALERVTLTSASSAERLARVETTLQSIDARLARIEDRDRR